MKNEFIKIRVTDSKKNIVKRDALKYGFGNMSALLMFCYEDFKNRKRMQTAERQWRKKHGHKRAS